MESDPEGCRILGWNPVHRCAPQLGFVQVLVDHSGYLNSVTSQPPADRIRATMGGGVDPDFPTSTLELPNQLTGSLAKWLVVDQQPPIPRQARLKWNALAVADDRLVEVE